MKESDIQLQPVEDGEGLRGNMLPGGILRRVVALKNGRGGRLEKI